jgi:hypothetical protein
MWWYLECVIEIPFLHAKHEAMNSRRAVHEIKKYNLMGEFKRI